VDASVADISEENDGTIFQEEVEHAQDFLKVMWKLKL